MSDLSQSAAGHDLSALTARALRRRQRHVRSVQRSETLRIALIGYTQQLRRSPGGLPARYALHLLVGLLVPLAIIASSVPLSAPILSVPQLNTPDTATSDLVVPIAPVSLDTELDGDTPAPDSAFAEIDAQPVATLRPGLLHDQPIEAIIVADLANVRGGPGTDYDKVGALPAGTPLQVLAQYNGWYRARGDDERVVWVAATGSGRGRSRLSA